jgi:hypothetical protein
MQIVGHQSGDLLSVQQAEPPVYDRRRAYPVTNRGYVRSGFVSPLEIRLGSIGAKSEVCNYKSLIVLGPGNPIGLTTFQIGGCINCEGCAVKNLTVRMS